MKFEKPKKFNKTKAKNKLDKIFSLLVRSVGQCELAGEDKIKCGGCLQCAHIIGRGNLFLRWNRLNALCICAGHHVYYTYHPEAWRELMIKVNPINYPKLLKAQNNKIKFNEVFFQDMERELV